MPRLETALEEVQSPKHRRAYLLRLDGIVSTGTLPVFREALQTPASSGLDLVVDFAGVSYINSTGLGELLRVSDELQVHDRHLVLTHVSRPVLQLLTMLGFASILPVTEDLDAALEALDAGPAAAPDQYPTTVGTMAGPERPQAGASAPGATVVLGLPRESYFSKFLQRCFAGQETETLLAGSRADFARILGERDIDVVILDSDLPDFQDICAMLKTDARNGVLSIITIYTTEEDGRQVTTFRVMEDEYVVEPFEVREIMALIEAEYARCADEGQALRQEARLTIPSEARDIVEATKTLENMLTPLPLEETARNAFLYAVREAIDNARRHGNREDPAKRIEARFILTGEAVAVEVRDEGPGFEYSYYLDNARELSAVEQARRKHEAGEHGGLGINLMLRCCDDVEYLDPGNAVRLTKRLS